MGCADDVRRGQTRTRNVIDMKKHYFISDLHLGAAYIANAREHEARVIRFLDSIKVDAASLYLLGDILDYWFEYRNVVPQGHVRFFGKLAELADAGVQIFWMTGNHDVWLRNYLKREIGLTVYYGHTTISLNGQELFISHGDDVGKRSMVYRITRALFYNRFCQILYAAIHPRWATQVATGISTKNRTSRDLEKEQQAIEHAAQALVDFSCKHAAEYPTIKHYVYGHLHLARQQTINNDVDITFLGDWISQDTYAVFDGKQFKLSHFK